MRCVLLDANALMMPVELNVRVFDELDRLLGGRTDRFGVPVEPTRRNASDRPVPSVPAERSDNATDGSPNGGFDEPKEAIEAERGAANRNRAESGIDGVALLVPEAVVAELDDLSGEHGTEGIAASVGSDLARERCTTRPHEATYADDAILELATDRRERVEYVLTNDRELGERLYAQNVGVIRLRGHDQLTITNS
jgi:rRNA-processing protein FCF1